MQYGRLTHRQVTTQLQARSASQSINRVRANLKGSCVACGMRFVSRQAPPAHWAWLPTAAPARPRLASFPHTTENTAADRSQTCGAVPACIIHSMASDIYTYTQNNQTDICAASAAADESCQSTALRNCTIHRLCPFSQYSQRQILTCARANTCDCGAASSFRNR